MSKGRLPLVLVALLTALAAAPAAADSSGQTAPRDDSRDWQPVSGAEAELDSLLVGGAGLVLAGIGVGMTIYGLKKKFMKRQN